MNLRARASRGDSKLQIFRERGEDCLEVNKRRKNHVWYDFSSCVSKKKPGISYKVDTCTSIHIAERAVLKTNDKIAKYKSSSPDLLQSRLMMKLQQWLKDLPWTVETSKIFHSDLQCFLDTPKPETQKREKIFEKMLGEGFEIKNEKLEYMSESNYGSSCERMRTPKTVLERKQQNGFDNEA